MKSKQPINYPQIEELQILRQKQVSKKTSLSRTTIWRLIKTNNFPTPISLGVKRTGWYAHEIEDWMRSRPRTR